MTALARVFRTEVLSVTAVDGTNTPAEDAALRARTVLVTGTLTANANLVLPLREGVEWYVFNDTTGGFSLVVKGPSGAGVTVGPDVLALVVCDGVDFRTVESDGGAPTDATYVVASSHADLSAERVATTTATITVNTATAGQMKWDLLLAPLASIGNSGGAAGDIAYWDGSNWVRRAKETDGDVLTLASGVPVWAQPSGTFTTQTVTTYQQLGAPGAFSYPATGLIRVGSPSVAGNRNIVTFEPNVGGSDINAISTDTSDNLALNGTNLHLQAGGSTKVTIGSTKVTQTIASELGTGTYATAGLIRVAHTQPIILGRNTTNTADMAILATDGSNGLTVGGANVVNTIVDATTGVYLQTAGATRVLAAAAGLYIVSGKLLFGGASTDVSISSGTATPEGAITAPVGSLRLRSDGAAGTSLYVKESGTGNTGWTAVSSFTPAYGSMTRDADLDNLTTDGTFYDVADWDGTSGVAAVGVTEDKAAGTWTIVTTGVYRVSGMATIGVYSDQSNNVTMQVVADGTMIPGMVGSFGPDSAADVIGNWSFDKLVSLTAGQVVKVQFLSSNNGSITESSIRYATFSIQRIA